MIEQVTIDRISYTDLLAAIDTLIDKKLDALKVHREDRMISRKEAAELLGKSPRTVLRMVERDMLEEHCTKAGSRPRYRYSEVMQLKAKRNARI